MDSTSSFDPVRLHDHITVIKNDKDLILCLICMTELPSHNSNDQINLSIHVHGSKHRKNLKQIFKTCVPDDFCEKNEPSCMKIIQNSVFDLSILLKNERSYVHRFENHIVCLICRDIVCKANDSHETVKGNIFCHVQSKGHLENIKHNVCWVYPLASSDGFLMFHKTILYCSICDHDYFSEDNTLLQRALNHLVAVHPNELVPTSYGGNFSSVLTGNFASGEISPRICEKPMITDTIERSKKQSRRKDKNRTLNDSNSQDPSSFCENFSRSEAETNIQNNLSEKENLPNLQSKSLLNSDIHPFITFFKDHKVTLCIVCKCIVAEFNNGKKSDELQFHLSPEMHLKNSELVRKKDTRVNDMTLAVNSESTCVVQCLNDLMCLICKRSISRVTGSYETIIGDVVNHFETNLHLINELENQWWYDYVKFNTDLVVFKNHISLCVETALNYARDPEIVIQRVNDHLQKEYRILKTIKRDAGAEKSKNQSCKEKLRIKTNNEETIPVKDSSLEMDESNHQYNEDGNRLICSECKEDIEIFNNDVEFSMDLHLEKHKTLSEINNCLDFDGTDDRESVCPNCQNVIPIFNKDLNLSMNLHRCSADGERLEESKNVASNHFAKIFDQLQQKYKDQCDFFVWDGVELQCELCNCALPLPSSFENVYTIFENHIEEPYHNEQLNMCKMASKLPDNKTVQKKEKIDPWDMFKNIDDPSTLSLMNSVIAENNKYIERCEYFSFCKVCKCCFLPFGNEKELMKNFASHFMCKNHKKKLGRRVDDDSATYKLENNPVDESVDYTSHQLVPINSNNSAGLFQKLKILQGFHLNSQFFFTQGNRFLCTLCKISFPCDEINKIRKHCYAETHSMILAENGARYISNHKNKYLLNCTQPFSDKFVKPLKKLAEDNYRLNNPTVTPNLLYIGNNGKKFVCLVCNVNINYSQSGSTVACHFQTNLHKQNTYQLNCKSSSVTIKRNTPEERLLCDAKNGCEKSHVPKTYPLDCEKVSSSIEKKPNQRGLNTDKENENKVFHKEETLINNTVNNSKVSDIFEKIPKEFELYRDFITAEGNNFSCQLCDLTVLSKKNFEVDCRILQEHMSSLLHREQYILFTSNGTSKDSDRSISQSPWERFGDGSNFKTLLEIKILYEKNKQYIVKGKVHFTCCLCDMYFLYFDDQDMEVTIAAHSLTTLHKKNLKSKSKKFNAGSLLKNDNKSVADFQLANIASTPRLENICETNVKDPILRKIMKSTFAMSLNKQYIRRIDDSFFCEVCQMSINFSENGSHLKSHCYSQTHNNNLAQSSIVFMECLNKHDPLLECQPNELKFKNVLKMLVKSSYERTNLTLTANLFFIRFTNTAFVCCLCNKEIKFTIKGETVMGHICCKMHTMNAYKLNCLSRYDPPSEDTSEGVTNSKSELDSSNETYVPKSNVPIVGTSIDELRDIEDNQEQSSSNSTTVERTGMCVDSENDFESCDDDSLQVESKHLSWDFIDVKVSPSGYNINVNYMCPDCNESITITDEDVTVSFQMHYKHGHPNIEELLSAHEILLYNYKFKEELFECLPDSNQKDKENVTIETDTLYCNPCKAFVKTERTDIFESAVQLFVHLSSKFHKDQTKLCSKDSRFNLHKPRFQPYIKFYTKDNAPEDVKDHFFNIKNSLQKMQNVAKDGLVEKAGGKEQDNSKNINCELLNITPRNEVGIFGADDIESKDNQEQLNNESDSSAELQCSSRKDVCDLNDLFKKLTQNLSVHQEFMTLTENRITCLLCLITLKADENELKRHLIDFNHKRQFLAELKFRVGPYLSSKVKHLMFVYNQLYCEVCQCYITPWNDFDSICDGVKSHLEMLPHRNPCETSLDHSKIETKLDEGNTLNVEENRHAPSDAPSLTEYSDETQVKSVKLTNDQATERKESSPEHCSSSTSPDKNCSTADSALQRLKDSIFLLDENLEFIVLHGTKLYCGLCDEGIFLSRDYEVLADKLNAHLASDRHGHFLKKLRGHEAQTKLLSALIKKDDN